MFQLFFIKFAEYLKRNIALKFDEIWPFIGIQRNKRSQRKYESFLSNESVLALIFMEQQQMFALKRNLLTPAISLDLYGKCIKIILLDYFLIFGFSTTWEEIFVKEIPAVSKTPH